MPIEIGELVVTAAIVPENSETSSSVVPESAAAFSPELQETLVRECVQQVMELLRQQTER
jgi:Family of unknown function (DUF5908)